MQSKISYFNKTLFRKNLTRYWPLWGGVSALGALAPLAVLADLIQRGSLFVRDGNPLNTTATLYHVLVYGVPVISLLYAILCALAVWSYLFNARSVSMMHSLPATRKGLFITNVLSGLVMMAIPYAVTGVLSVLVMLLTGMFEPVGVLVTILGVMGESLFYFATATFAAFCTGSVFAMPALYGIFHVLAWCVEWVLTVFFNGFYYGVEPVVRMNFSGMLNPTAYLMGNVYVNATFKEVMTPGGYVTMELDSVSLDGWWVIAVYALAGALLLAFCWALYARRRSESAGDVVAVGWMKPIFRYGAAFCAALPGGLGLYGLFWHGFQKGDRFEVLPMIVLTALAGVIGYYIASMLLAKSFKVFKACWKGAAATVVFCAVLCAGTALDPLGVETRQPDVDRVVSAYVSISGSGYCSADVDDPAAIQEIMKAHSAVIAQRDALQLSANYWRQDGRWIEDGGMNHASITITYELDNERSIHRSYSFYYSKDPQRQPEGVIPALSRLAVNPVIQQKNIFGHMEENRYDNRENMRITSGKVQNLYNPEKKYLAEVSLDAAQAQALREAVERDIQAGHFGRTMFQEDDGELRYSSGISFYYAYDVRDSDGKVWEDTGSISSLSFSVYCTETIAALKELGILDETHQLVLDADWNRIQDELSSGESYYSEYPYDGGEPDFYYEAYYGEPISESAAMGVIGGADGPTEIVLS